MTRKFSRSTMGPFILALAVAALLPAAATATPNNGCTADGGHAHIAIGDGVASENAGTVTFTITCNPCGEVNANTWWSTFDGTATGGVDFTAITGQLITIGTNPSEPQTYNIVVTLLDDTTFEGDETFTVGLGGSGPEANPSVGPPCLILDDTTGDGTIQENDPMNVPPVADAGGPYLVNEGASVGLDGTGSSDPDSGPSPLTYAWDLDGDTFYDDATGATPTFSAAALNGPDTVTIGLEVGDGAATATDTGTVNVVNVAPSVNTPGTPSPSDEGDSITASATFTDPAGSGDAPFTCTVDYGEGGGDEAGSVAGSTCTGPSHVYGDNGSYTVEVCVTDKDGGTGCNSTSHVVDNVPPSVATPVVAPEPSDEGSPAVASATFTDPGTDDSPFACTVDYGEGGGDEAGTVAGSTCTGPSHVYGDNGSYTVEVCVTDKDGGTGCNSTSHSVDNVPPTVATPEVAPEPSDEGALATVSAEFTDPGFDDSPFTCTIDYGAGGGATSETVSGMTCSGSFTWGDNGSYTVEVCVTDKDGGEGCASTIHVVNNLPPDVTLDLSTAVAFPGGDAFLGRQGDSQSHDADGTDPGSDDLTFDWDFGFSGSAVSTTYYNDTGDPSGSPDPAQSPGGTFPFAASDTASVTFADPGVYLVQVDLTDDDGENDSEGLPKLVTGDIDCTRSQGFWKKQLKGKGHQHIDVVTLQAFLDIVDFASSVFTEEVPADFASKSPDMRTKATQQALAAWLNFAAGAVGWTEVIDTNGDMVADTPVYLVFATLEAILTNAGATHAELVMAKDLAELINLLDESDPACSDG